MNYDPYWAGFDPNGRGQTVYNSIRNQLGETTADQSFAEFINQIGGQYRRGDNEAQNPLIEKWLNVPSLAQYKGQLGADDQIKLAMQNRTGAQEQASLDGPGGSPDAEARIAAQSKGGLFGGNTGILGLLAAAAAAYATGGLSLAGEGLAGLGSEALAMGGAADFGLGGAGGSLAGLAGGAEPWMGGFGDGIQAGLSGGTQFAGPTSGGGMGLEDLFSNFDEWGNGLYSGSEGAGIGDAGAFDQWGSALSGTSSGSVLDQNGITQFLQKLGINPTSSIGQMLSKLGSGGGLGALIGAAAGGLGANGKPAGQVTTTQDVPDWQRPYIQQLMQQAQGVYGANGPGNQSLIGPATQQMQDTIGGKYLDPNTNPYLDQTYRHAAGLVNANVASTFENANRYGSGAHQGVLQEGLNNLATNIYGGNYQQERTRQQAASTAAPAFTTGAAATPYAGLTAYGNIIGNRYGSSNSSPYFTNPLAGALSGGLLGSQLGNMFGTPP